jgi:hypothetical protein
MVLLWLKVSHHMMSEYPEKKLYFLQEAFTTSDLFMWQDFLKLPLQFPVTYLFFPASFSRHIHPVLLVSQSIHCYDRQLVNIEAHEQ